MSFSQETTSLKETLKLNNAAVDLFRSNDPQSAAKSFYKSLLFAKKLLNSQESHYPQTELNDEYLSKLKSCHSSSRLSPSRETEDKLFFYKHALVLYEPSIPLQHSPEALCVYSASIVFNIALLHHQIGLTNCNARSLAIAEKQYNACLRLLSGFEMNLFNETSLLIVIVATNNLALLDLEKGRVGDANARFHFLLSALRDYHDLSQVVFTSDEKLGILSNALMADQLVASPAA